MRPMDTNSGTSESRRGLVRRWPVIVIALVFGAIGMIVGALLGGNYAEQFVFNGVQGYEATGQIGFILGISIGLFAGWEKDR